LDGDDLGLDHVVLAEVLVDVLDVVPVDLGDMDQPHLATRQGQEGGVRGDAAHGPIDDRADLEICQDSSSYRTTSSAGSFHSGASPDRPVSHRPVWAVNTTLGWVEEASLAPVVSQFASAARGSGG